MKVLEAYHSPESQEPDLSLLSGAVRRRRECVGEALQSGAQHVQVLALLANHLAQDREAHGADRRLRLQSAAAVHLKRYNGTGPFASHEAPEPILKIAIS